MKTPREILFDNHQGVESKLDAVRQTALQAIVAPPSPEHSRAPRRNADGWSLAEVIASFRWHVAGLGVAWLVVVVLNIDPAPNPVDGIARAKIPPPRELLAAMLEHRRELLEMTDTPVAVEPPSLPPRRTELRSRIAMG